MIYCSLHLHCTSQHTHSLTICRAKDEQQKLDEVQDDASSSKPQHVVILHRAQRAVQNPKYILSKHVCPKTMFGMQKAMMQTERF